MQWRKLVTLQDPSYAAEEAEGNTWRESCRHKGRHGRFVYAIRRTTFIMRARCSTLLQSRRLLLRFAETFSEFFALSSGIAAMTGCLYSRPSFRPRCLSRTCPREARRLKAFLACIQPAFPGLVSPWPSLATLGQVGRGLRNRGFGLDKYTLECLLLCLLV